MAGEPSVFFSYSRADVDTVLKFADAFRAEGVEVRMDIEFLKPGEAWADSIRRHLLAAGGLVVFVSPASLESRWIPGEITTFGQVSGRPIFPVLIGGLGAGNLPPSLADRYAVTVRTETEIRSAASNIARALRETAGAGVPSSEEYRRAGQFADHIAEDLRGPVPETAEASGRVFLVHGHDHRLRDEVERFLLRLGVEPVILAQVGEKGVRTIVDKFERSAARAAFAVVVLSADDKGASREQYDETPGEGDRTLKYRSRENAILELGYFYGKLGWERVFIVRGKRPTKWPDFEYPSDLGGVEFFEVDGPRDWKDELASRLTEAGLLRS